MSHVRQRLTIPILILVVCLALAACSSSSDSSGGTSGGSGTSTNAPGQKEAAARAAKYLTRPTSIGVTEKIGKPIPKQRVAFIICSLPSCTYLNDVADHAAAALGWDLVKINEGVTPQSVQTAYAQAARENLDGIVTGGFDPRQAAPEQLKTLTDQGVPVFAGSIAGEAGDGVTAIFDGTETNKIYGQIQADFAYGKFGTKASSLIIEVPTFPTIMDVVNSYDDNLKKLCSSCDNGRVTVSAADLGTPRVATAVTAYLTQHPDVSVIETSDCDAVAGLGPALKTAGSDAKIICLYSGSLVNPDIRSGLVVGAVAADPMEWTMKGFDAMVRTATEKSIDPDVNTPEPQWLLTKDNLPASDAPHPLVEDFEQQYYELWGVPAP